MPNTKDGPLAIVRGIFYLIAIVGFLGICVSPVIVVAVLRLFG